MTPSTPYLELQYRRESSALPAVEVQMDELFLFSRSIANASPLLCEWYLTSNSTRENALLYRAFDEQGVTDAALVETRSRNMGVDDIRAISVWNGAQSDEESAALCSRCNVLGRPDAFSFSLRLRPEVLDWETGVRWLEAAIAIWPARFASFGPFWYAENKVFEDRPGVGWMLFLPTTLTAQQVPEASLLHPVTNEQTGQIGTIIVSVSDGPFSLDNNDHVKRANDIERRLVDQGLLPRYMEI